MVTSFNEKPDQEASPISGGFFVLNKKIGDYIHEDGCVFEKEVLPKLSDEGQLGAHVHTGFWQCMDTYREQMLLEDMWKSGNAPWKVW